MHFKLLKYILYEEIIAKKKYVFFIVKENIKHKTFKSKSILFINLEKKKITFENNESFYASCI